MSHPKIAGRSCESCKTYRYTEDGEIETNSRTKLPVLRGSLPTPCDTCPRKSPEREAETTLSEKNWRAYEFYLAVRATGGACLVGRQKTDWLLRRLLGLIDSVVRGHELSVQTQASLMGVAVAMGLRGVRGV